jgi:hypothetical protein
MAIIIKNKEIDNPQTRKYSRIFGPEVYESKISKQSGFDSQIEINVARDINTLPKMVSSQIGINENKADVIDIPELENIRIHNAFLTSTRCTLIQTLWAIVTSKALQNSITLLRTSVSIFHDHSERRTQAILHVTIDANAGQAIAFWDGLENNIQEWITGLSESNRLIFLKDISLEIDW